MTIREVAAQLHNLTDGRLNGKTFSRLELETYISKMFLGGGMLKAGNRLIMTASLPDGEWYFAIERWGSYRDGYDYDIPDTREQELRIKALLD